MNLHGPVLVGTDLSPGADEALRQGGRLAADLDGRLIVCHVIPELLPVHAIFEEFKRAHAGLEQSTLEKARTAVQEQVDATLAADNVRIEIVVDFGSPASDILSDAEERGAGVIALGPGGVALDVVRHASSAVLVARQSPHGPVVAPTDFSDPSLPALAVAASEARRRGVPLHLLHAVDVAVFTLGDASGATMPYLADRDPIAVEALDDLRAIATRRLEQYLIEAGVPGEIAVLSGSATEVIAQYAESVGAQLVVVGTHGRTGLRRLMLGSTAASVIERAPCSVLVVRAPRRQAG